jgi:site-specific DNA-methyltransferase (adenine-specific)
MHTGFGDSGSAARFFYETKATRNDRNEGCEAFFWHEPPGAKRWLRIDEATYRRLEAENVELRKAKKTTHKIAQGNIHPTVKPTDLMGYLMRLVTRPGGIVLDPFMGSGSTGKAAVLEGFGFVGIERDPDHFDVAKARILDAIRQRDEARRLASAQLEMFP